MSRRLNDATPAEWDAACAKAMKGEPSTEAKEFIAKVRSLRDSQPEETFNEENTTMADERFCLISCGILIGLFIGITLF
jgi:hypothetical protein